MFHNMILFLLSISVLSYFKRVRALLMVFYPTFGMLFTLLSPEYSANLIGKFGITIKFDSTSKIFILASSISFLLTALHIAKHKKNISSPFSFLFLTSYATLMAVFISRDYFNLYVLLEVISIQAALMVLENKNEKKIWTSLKYLIIGGVGANIYLVGVAIYYSHASTFSALSSSAMPKLAFSLMMAGLMIRTGVFGAGMWLMQFHSTSDDELSAILSGAFINGGIYAMKIVADKFHSYSFQQIVAILVLLGGIAAIFSQSYKRTVALSTSVHLGIMSLFLNNTSIYVLSHSLAKTVLFLYSKEVKKRAMDLSTFLLLFTATSSLAGFPFTLGGFSENVLFKDAPLYIKYSALFATWITSAAILKKLLECRISYKVRANMILVMPFIFPFLGIINFVGAATVLALLFVKTKKVSIIYGENLEDNILIATALTVVMLWML